MYIIGQLIHDLLLQFPANVVLHLILSTSNVFLFFVLAYIQPSSECRLRPPGVLAADPANERAATDSAGKPFNITRKSLLVYILPLCQPACSLDIAIGNEQAYQEDLLC